METAQCRFQKGDKDKFTDKFGQLNHGVFEQYDALPGVNQNGHCVQVQGYLVIAKPFGPDTGDVQCFVPAGKLERDV